MNVAKWGGLSNDDVEQCFAGAGESDVQLNTRAIERRTFLKALSAQAAAGGALAGLVWRPAVGAADAITADRLIAGKDRRLIVHGAEPLEIETPVALLREHQLTPKQILFVRNNQDLANTQQLGPLPPEGWSIELAGLVEFPRVISARDLAEMEHVSHEIVLQCSGNGRALFAPVAPVKGSPWSRGAMGNVQFSGVRLSTLLDKAQCHVDARARFLTAEGRDAPLSADKADFEHSIPLDDALARSFLALSMNGEPIPALHGGPVRLITPGYYGTMNVKWVTRLRFESDETYNHNQLKRYRTPLSPIQPGQAFDYTLTNSEPNWRMRTKSVLFAPLDGERLKAGKFEAYGVAFNDGSAAIESVLLSTDGGATWSRAQLEAPSGPYAWYWWRAALDLPRGEHTILARAVDALGRSQPLDPAAQWNPDGYAFSGADRVSVHVG
jgi:DMSO/TMAO reductase YedYZ molybdopterin-dependent catalytic subunit